MSQSLFQKKSWECKMMYITGNIIKIPPKKWQFNICTVNTNNIM